MTTSINPQPAENEVECARCGAYFHMELIHCPNCGVSVYEPENDFEGYDPIPNPLPFPQQAGFWDEVMEFFCWIIGKEDLTQVLFSNSMEQIKDYDELLRKVDSDDQITEWSIAFVGKRYPHASRSDCIQLAFQRWKRDNR